jgi:hypothetical protein
MLNDSFTLYISYVQEPVQKIHKKQPEAEPQTFNESLSKAPSSKIAATTSSENDRKTLKQESQHLGLETATTTPYHTRKLLKNSDSQIIQSEAKRTSYMCKPPRKCTTIYIECQKLNQQTVLHYKPHETLQEYEKGENPQT